MTDFVRYPLPGFYLDEKILNTEFLKELNLFTKTGLSITFPTKVSMAIYRKRVNDISQIGNITRRL